MRNYFFGILFFLLGLGCGFNRNSAKQEVVCGILQEPQTLDPAKTDEYSVLFIAPNIYETLVTLHPIHLTPEPFLATSWDIQNNGTDYLFHIRPNVFFHDTTILSAESVKFSFDRQINPNSANYLEPNGGIYSQTMLGMIKSVETIDSLTVLFHLKYPYAPFLKTLASVYGAAIISPTSINKSQNDVVFIPKSTGPFKFMNWEPQKKISLSPNRNYWNKPPEIDLSFQIFDDTESMIRSFKNQTIDVIFSVSPNLRERFLFEPNCQVHINQTLSTIFLGMNCQRYPLNRKFVRQAILSAIDKQKLILYIYHGGANIASDILPFPVMVKPPGAASFNLKNSMNFLEKSGYLKRRPLILTCYHYSSRELLLPKAIKMFLSKISIDIVIQVIDDWNEFNYLVKSGQTDLFLDGWGSNFADQDDFLYSLFHSNSPSNTFFYENQKIDELLETARTLTGNTTERNATYLRVLKILDEDVPCIPLTHPQQMNVTSNKISNLQTNQLGYVIFEKVKKDDTE